MEVWPIIFSPFTLHPLPSTFNINALNMKHKLLLPLFAATAVLSCKEVPINIPAPASGPDPCVSYRKVLIEELTGVRCPNCPDGTAQLVALGSQLGDTIVVVSIHAAPGYDLPYPESQYDFRTADGTAMANFIGLASFYPTAAINRRIVPPETEPYLPRSIWKGIADEEKKELPGVCIDLETAFDAANRSLNISVTLTPRLNLSGEHRLTVLITQDSIQDVQKKGLDKIPDYIHRHVLRDVLTAPTGDIVSSADGGLSPLATVEKTFSYTLPAGWNEKHCSVVAFVHHGTTPDKEVLQVEEKHVIE